MAASVGLLSTPSHEKTYLEVTMILCNVQLGAQKTHRCPMSLFTDETLVYVAVTPRPRTLEPNTQLAPRFLARFMCRVP